MAVKMNRKHTEAGMATRPGKLTKRDVDSAVYDPDGPVSQRLWDGELKGFGVRLYPSGLKSYIFKYRFGGRQITQVLGSCEAMTLEKARAAAKHASAVLTEKLDPFAAQKEMKYEISFKEFAAIYLENHARAHKRSARNDAYHLEKAAVPAFGKVPLAEISGAHINRLHKKIGLEEKHPYQANRVLATLSKVFELARKWGYLPPESINPTRDIQKFREEKRHRPIADGELAGLRASIDSETSPYIRATFRLLLLLGCRVGELLSAKWEQADFERRIILFPQTKSGRAFAAPLSTPAIEILAALPRVKDNPYILPGGKPGEPLKCVSKAWKRILERAGLPREIRIHDLRHSFGTGLANAGVSLPIIGAAMNHSQPSVTARYAQPVEERVREAAELYARRMEMLQQGEKVDKQQP